MFEILLDTQTLHYIHLQLIWLQSIRIMQAIDFQAFAHSHLSHCAV